MLFGWNHIVWSSGRGVLYIYCFHFAIQPYAFLLLGSTNAGPFESLQTSSLGTSEELPSHYAMKTLEEQGALSVQQLIIGTYVSHAFII